MNYLKALWHELRGHRPIAVMSDSGNGAFIFCYECWNSGKDKSTFGYFQFAHPCADISAERARWGR